MNKNTFTSVKLAKGEVNVYDFGGIKLHAYKTNDFIDNEVFIVEKNGKAVVIESPCFFDNNTELANYLKDVEVEGMLVAYHGAGATFLPDVPKYATQNAVEYSENGGGKAFRLFKIRVLYGLKALYDLLEMTVPFTVNVLVLLQKPVQIQRPVNRQMHISPDHFLRRKP